MSEEAGSPTRSVVRIVSGGQTGVDRAALAFAIERGLEHGGWCPRGRRAEDGAIPARFALRETESADYAVRTERNVHDSDATLILARGELRGGTALTARLARTRSRPLLVVDPAFAAEEQLDAARAWLRAEAPRVLNVAGPRESDAPGIEAQASAFLREVFDAPGTR